MDFISYRDSYQSPATVCHDEPPSLTYLFNSSTVFIAMSKRLIIDTDYERSTLAFIHDYLESRIKLLRTIPVSITFNFLVSCLSFTFSKASHI